MDKATTPPSLGNLVTAITTTLVLTFLTTALHAEESPWKISMQFDTNGTGKYNACLPFAKELYNRLNQTDSGHDLVTWDWKDRDRASGRHAITIYREKKYFQDIPDQKLTKKKPKKSKKKYQIASL